MPEFTYAQQEVAEVRCEGFLSISGTAYRRWNHVHHFARDAAAALDTGDPQAIYDWTHGLAEGVHAMYEYVFEDQMSENWTLTTVRSKIINPFDGPFSDFAETVVGLATDPPDEPDDAMVLQKRTNRAGRRAQGRIYLAGIPDVIVENGVVEDGWTDTLLAKFADYITDGVAVTGSTDAGRWGVWSQTEFADSADRYTAFSLVMAITADRVMRRMTSREFPFRLIAGNG